MHLKTICLGLLEITDTSGYDIKEMSGRSLSHLHKEDIHSRQNKTLEGHAAQPAFSGIRCTIESGISAIWPGRDLIRAQRSQALPGQSGPSPVETA